MTNDATAQDPRINLQRQLHQLLLEAQEAVEAFERAEDDAAAELHDDEQRETRLLKAADFTRLKSKSPGLAESIASAGKARKKDLEMRKADTASLATAITALKAEVVKTGTRLEALKPPR